MLKSFVEKYNNLSDEELITKIRDNDEEAFEASLFEDDAEKVLQDEDFAAFADFEEELELDDNDFLQSLFED